MSDPAEKIMHLNDVILGLTRQRDSIQNDIDKVESEIRVIEQGLALPTEPGWYLTAEDTPCYLSEEGDWDDGWGHSGAAYGPIWHPLPLRRLEVVDG